MSPTGTNAEQCSSELKEKNNPGEKSQSLKAGIKTDPKICSTGFKCWAKAIPLGLYMAESFCHKWGSSTEQVQTQMQG